MPFETWFREAREKKRAADANPTGKDKLTDVEKRAVEVGTRLVHYQAIRDRSAAVGRAPADACPGRATRRISPSSPGRQEVPQDRRPASLSLLELDAAQALDTYWHDIPVDDRAMPGTQREVRRHVLRVAPRTARSGSRSRSCSTPSPRSWRRRASRASKVEAFQRPSRSSTRPRTPRPGQVAAAKAEALVVAARALGESVKPTSYPTVADDRPRDLLQRDRTRSGRRPDCRMALATVLLAVSLGFQGFERRIVRSASSAACSTAAGCSACVAGIGLETFGFSLRVAISGWAPVTNMYETVIWVSLVSAVLGLVFELIYRKTFAALAAAGVALLGTVLAANVPLLDPRHPHPSAGPAEQLLADDPRADRGLELRARSCSRRGSGMIATMYYLTATYRRSPSFVELALPLVPGLPLLAVGVFGLGGVVRQFGPSWDVGGTAY